MVKPRHKDRLTVKGIARSKPGKKYTDGGGLALLVSDIGSRSWSFRFERNGRDRAMVLGPLYGNGGGTEIPREERRGLTLAEARSEAAKAMQLLKTGIDPITAKHNLKTANVTKAAEKAAADAQLKSFEALALEYYDTHSADWKNKNYRGKFLASLKRYVFPTIGKLLPATIDVALVRSVIEPIWLTRNPTADRVRGRIENVLDYATALGLRSGENPARWAVLETVLPKKIKSTRHHRALSYEDIPAFVTRLANENRGVVLEFLILTGARSIEVLGARWSEFELGAVPRMMRDDEGVEKPVMGPFWIIPAERMKEGRQHRVPLSDRAVEILNGLPHKGEYIFNSNGQPLGSSTFFNLLDAMGYSHHDDDGRRDDITTHGFRSSFRDWAGEETSFTADICEAAISHVVGSATQTAYQHGTLFEKRRELMKVWERYCLTGGKSDSERVVPIRRKAGG